MRYIDVQRTQQTRVRAEQVILGDPREVAEWEDAQDPGDLRECCGMLMPSRVAARYESSNSWQGVALRAAVALALVAGVAWDLCVIARIVCG